MDPTPLSKQGGDHVLKDNKRAGVAAVLTVPTRCKKNRKHIPAVAGMAVTVVKDIQILTLTVPAASHTSLPLNDIDILLIDIFILQASKQI